MNFLLDINKMQNYIEVEDFSTNITYCWFKGCQPNKSMLKSGFSLNTEWKFNTL